MKQLENNFEAISRRGHEVIMEEAYDDWFIREYEQLQVRYSVVYDYLESLLVNEYGSVSGEVHPKTRSEPVDIGEDLLVQLDTQPNGTLVPRTVRLGVLARKSKQVEPKTSTITANYLLYLNPDDRVSGNFHQFDWPQHAGQDAKILLSQDIKRYTFSGTPLLFVGQRRIYGYSVLKENFEALVEAYNFAARVALTMGCPASTDSGLAIEEYDSSAIPEYSDTHVKYDS